MVAAAASPIICAIAGETQLGIGGAAAGTAASSLGIAGAAGAASLELPAGQIVGDGPGTAASSPGGRFTWWRPCYLGGPGAGSIIVGGGPIVGGGSVGPGAGAGGPGGGPDTTAAGAAGGPGGGPGTTAAGAGGTESRRFGADLLTKRAQRPFSP